jgi:hypothetical protein
MLRTPGNSRALIGEERRGEERRGEKRREEKRREEKRRTHRTRWRLCQNTNIDD